MTTWVEVRREALIANATAVRRMIGRDCSLCAVVKANGYGHGAVLAGKAFLEAGASTLGVTTLDEAVDLRRHGIDAPILLLASHPPDEAQAVVEHGLTATVSHLAAAERLSALAVDHEREVTIHLLVDTGMGRDGCLPPDLTPLYDACRALPNVRVEGVFTHFPNSIEADKKPMRRQFETFRELVAYLVPRPPIVHCANSGAAVDLPEARLDMVRVGTLLYGQYPSQHVSRTLELSPTWRLRSRLVEVRRLPAGAAIGYGSEYVLKEDRLIGTLLVGWQHGFTLVPESLASGTRGAMRAMRRKPPTVKIHGVECPVVGRISMQTCNVDLTAVPGVQVGDIAEIDARRVTLDRGVPRVARIVEG